MKNIKYIQSNIHLIFKYFIKYFNLIFPSNKIPKNLAKQEKTPPCPKQAHKPKNIQANSKSKQTKKIYKKTFKLINLFPAKMSFKFLMKNINYEISLLCCVYIPIFFNDS